MIHNNIENQWTVQYSQIRKQMAITMGETTGNRTKVKAQINKRTKPI